MTVRVLRNILYSERSILDKLLAGDADDVYEYEWDILMQCAGATNECFKRELFEKQAYMMYADMLETFSSFQHHDKIRKMSEEVHRLLIDGIVFPRFGEGEGSLLGLLKNGQADAVTDEQTQAILAEAKTVNKKYISGTVTKEEMMRSVDLLFRLLPYQDIEWVMEFTANIANTLTYRTYFLDFD